MRKRFGIAHLVGAALVVGTTSAPAQAPQTGAAASATPLLTRPLVGLDGKEGLMLTVDMPPGASSPAHRHNANTFVYVLEGTIVMQVAGGEAKTLRRGETFYETPSDVHTVSRNASTTEPARILVFMVKEAGTPATVPAQ